ncbi:MAG: 3-phenylpropionate/cinnamic acid dioxygenase subunit beta [Pseudomonadota bacterium]|nr:3-phenylpropionate/cinnamic acid dioxygenase subunit beta [Pseudomonadota bacterium]MEC8202530.1 3-phenylpropionate/cinnamic acid dioxygenase subunit beta [Pseudomonadota bacterium]
MDTTPERALLDQFLLRHQVEQFYNAEAELLDSRQFNAWLDLLTDDVRYWMPVTINKEYGEWDKEHTREGKDLNWFDEGKFELEQRVRQIETGVHWAEEPVSRTSHMFSNLQITNNRDELATRCRFLVYRNRTETETDFFVGKRNDTLRRDGTGFKIAAREIFLDQSVLLAKNLTLFF